MISRITECTVNPDHLDQLRTALDTVVIPTLREQQGFVDAVESLDPESGELLCMSLWQTREDADRFDQNVFPKLSEQLGSLALEEPTVRYLEVQTSTVHKIAASKAA